MKEEGEPEKLSQDEACHTDGSPGGGGEGSPTGGTAPVPHPNAGEGTSYHTCPPSEVEALMDAGNGPGGYVQGWGYVMPQLTVLPQQPAVSPSAQEAYKRALTFTGTPYLHL